MIGNIIAGLALIIGAVNSAYQFYKDKNDIQVEQANRVSAWIMTNKHGDPFKDKEFYMTVIIRNASEQPVYNAIVSSGTYQGAGQPYLTGTGSTSSIGTIPPGTYVTKVPWPGAAMHIRVEAVIAFIDTKGVSWIRDAEGHLQKIDDPRTTLKIDLPPSNWKPIVKYDPEINRLE